MHQLGAYFGHQEIADKQVPERVNIPLLSNPWPHHDSLSPNTSIQHHPSLVLMMIKSLVSICFNIFCQTSSEHLRKTLTLACTLLAPLGLAGSSTALPSPVKRDKPPSRSSSTATTVTASASGAVYLDADEADEEQEWDQRSTTELYREQDEETAGLDTVWQRSSCQGIETEVPEGITPRYFIFDTE